MKIILCVLSALLLCSCVSTSGHVVVGKQRTPTKPEDVRIYIRSPKNYEEIAIVSANSKASFAPGEQKKIDKVIERLKNEAAALGANGLLLKGVDDKAGGMVGGYSANAFYGANILFKSGEAVAIWVIEP